MATSITRPAGNSTVGCAFDLEISSAQPNVNIIIKMPVPAAPVSPGLCNRDGESKPIIMYPPKDSRAANVTELPTADPITATATVAVRGDADVGSLTEQAEAAAAVAGKGRANPVAPRNWKKKIRVSLCDYFSQACLRHNRSKTVTIVVRDKNGNVLDSITVTLSAECDCQGQQA